MNKMSTRKIAKNLFVPNLCPIVSRIYGVCGKSIYIGCKLPSTALDELHKQAVATAVKDALTTVCLFDATTTIAQSYKEFLKSPTALSKYNNDLIVHYYCTLAPEQERWLSTESQLCTVPRGGDFPRATLEKPLVLSLIDSKHVLAHYRKIILLWRADHGVSRGDY
jgi:hypothetical protein